MRRFGVSPTLHDLHFLFLSLCRYKLVSDAQAFFDKVKADFSVTQKTYSILMNGWAKVEDSKMALNLFDEMRNRGLQVDVAAYNTLLAALCSGKRVSEAYDRLLEMQKVYGLEPDAASYSVFIRTACDAKELGTTVKLLDRMKRYSVAPNVYTYNCVVRLFCEMEKIDDAYELLDEMLERGVKPDVWSYNAVLAVHCKLKEVNKALRLLSRMDRDSCLPERHTYNMLLKMLVGVGRVDRAMEVWDGMEKRGFYPAAPSYSVMIHGLCRKKGGIEHACRYFEMMVEEGIPPYQSTCELLKDQLLHLGLKEKVDILFDKMQRSSSCTIQELSSAMDRRKKPYQDRKEIEECTV
ncbi:HCP-like protein [Dioscorea alata]|uniref:HCP-like protein n=1 Tax=Dioscorea alata TaxID=55571 RepID=A0ACB7WB93_DIOAL|nr:HCP-like protein [Dioscorea alata]